ncbi:hypothetical protein SAMN04487949_0285 [Halogranum gelatinilyticum]|uniref:CAAX prenyl protease 2/Lysostaphin resistance protein A-like domain-containing protein n=1 Tax=Halogranum gelatinilyticum TaxID=660521 RepID=A0A1G9P8M2_9EURY|nr:type II CAAX endopeptidase family protein [Halogranum gelatinilyticum]SDL95138.1 hypothetical protein SAMN04487949_0285 [Halogranum gelatinilyticum]
MVSPVERLKRVVWNVDEHRLRAPWRLVVGTVAVGIVVALFALATGLVVGVLGLGSAFTELFGAAAYGLVRDLVGVLFTGLGFLAGIAVVGRFLDRRRFADFGFHLDRAWWVDLGFGLALGAGLMTAIFALGVAAGWFAVTGLLVGESVLAGLVALLVLFLFVGVYEELLVRGYLLTNVAEGLAGYVGDRGAVAVAVALSSAVFGVLHATNPNASLVSVLTITLAGVMLALGYVLTNELAIPIGLHITWNLFQGAVYGFPVSGLPIDASLVGTRETGPDLVTGGQFGPEAGLLGVGAILLGCVLTVWWVRWRRGATGIHAGVTTPELRVARDDGRSAEDGD